MAIHETTMIRIRMTIRAMNPGEDPPILGISRIESVRGTMSGVVESIFFGLEANNDRKRRLVIGTL